MQFRLFFPSKAWALAMVTLLLRRLARSRIIIIDINIHDGGAYKNDNHNNFYQGSLYAEK